MDEHGESGSTLLKLVQTKFLAIRVFQHLAHIGDESLHSGGGYYCTEDPISASTSDQSRSTLGDVIAGIEGMIVYPF